MKTIRFAILPAATFLISATAFADTTLYGHLRYSLNSIDEDTAGGIDGIQGKDNVSLFGLKGSVGEGTKAFFHLQTGAPSDGNNGRAFQQRFFFGGLKGGFGKVAYGRMTNAYKFPGFKLDPFYNLSHIGAGGTYGAGGATYGLSPATNGFTDNALQYFTPSFGGGITFNVGTYIDDTNEDEHGVNAGLLYKNGGINAGVQFASNGKTGTIPNVAADGDALRIHGGYKAARWGASASYEQVDIGTIEDVGYIYVTGQFKAAEKTRLVLSVGNVDDGPAEGTGYTGGIFQTVAPKTELYANFSTASIEPAGGVNTDPSVFSVGAIHKF